MNNYTISEKQIEDLNKIESKIDQTINVGLDLLNTLTNDLKLHTDEAVMEKKVRSFEQWADKLLEQ